MKNQALPLLFVLLHFFGIPLMAQVKMGENPKELNASALLELESSNKGFLPTRLSTSQRDAISLPAKGLLIYNTSTNQIEVNFGTPEVPEWNAGFSSSIGLSISAQDTARWNQNGSWTARVSPTGDTLYLPNGSKIILPGISQLNYPTAPTVKTNPPGYLSAGSVLLSGEILRDGGRPVLQRGFVWSKMHNPVLGAVATSNEFAGSGIGKFQTILKDLLLDSLFIRAVAITSVDTTYGNEEFFTFSIVKGSVSDIDGHVYKTVQIGPLTWMAENLRTSRYANGDTIRHSTSALDWVEKRTYAMYAHYNFNEAYDSIFGKLYTFFVAEDNRNVCPTGWHIPSLSEFDLTINNPDINGNASHLRAVETLGNGGYWFAPNFEVTNKTGFSALPGGNINYEGSSVGKNIEAWFWTSTLNSYWATAGVNIKNLYGFRVEFRDSNRPAGYSIRCVKDY